MTRAVQIDRHRLSKLLGMLGSAHDGEIAAAGRAADRLVRGAGMSWPDVILPDLPPPPQPKPAGLADAEKAIAFCLKHSNRLTPWEAEFLASVSAQSFKFSKKQLDVFGRIVAKIRAATGDQQ